MPRLTTDQWAALRLEWEGEPTASYLGLSEKYGINVSSVSRKATKEGWSKSGQIGSINEAAQRRADSETNADGNAKQTQRDSIGDLASRQESECVRAAVLVRHRGEWASLEAFRQAALDVMTEAHQSGDRAGWQAAKTAADTAKANLQALEIKQAGERRAWGLDEYDIPDLDSKTDAELRAILSGKSY